MYLIKNKKNLLKKGHQKEDTNMIKLFCTDKLKKGGVTVSYMFIDETGKTYTLSRAETIALLKDKNYEVLNLQIDSIGRIVYKGEALEKNKQNQEAELTSIFELALNMFKENKIMTLIYENNQIKYLDDPIGRVSFVSHDNILTILKKFEDYVRKSNRDLAKLEIVNEEKNWRYITYGSVYLECTFANISDRYPVIDDINKFKIYTNVDKKRFDVIKRTMPLFDPKINRFYENALAGIFVYDKANRDASIYAIEQADKNLRNSDFVKKHTRKNQMKSNPRISNTSKKPIDLSKPTPASRLNKKSGLIDAFINLFNYAKRDK